jgi:hypothetical protein
VDPQDFIAELSAMVTNHWNSPAIIMWDIFNEGQGEQGSGNGVGQANTPYLVSLVKNLDPSRLVDQASGWTYFGVGDVIDAHNYPDPLCPASTTQAEVCGEFGGVWLGVAGHTWSPSSSDVDPTQVAAIVTPQIEALTGELPPLIHSNGLSAAVYTEISDVEIELAGLRTFDRRILKPDLFQMQTNFTALTGNPMPTNMPPVLAEVEDVTLTAGQTLLVTNFATDVYVPAQALTWSLLGQPAGATINPTTGVISWRPAVSQSPSTNVFTVVVSDNGTPPLSTTQNFSVVVLSPAAPFFRLPTSLTENFSRPSTGVLDRIIMCTQPQICRVVGN